MSFLPNPGEDTEDNYPYEFSGDEDTRLRKGFIDRKRTFCIP